MSTHTRIAHMIGSTIAAFACLMLLSSTALAANAGAAKQEVSTAYAHAMMAKAAQSEKMAHAHLHHVINCLVGPNGQGYDAAAGTPCKGQGNGAIPDSTSNAALNKKLETALSDAQSGLKSKSLAAIHKDAGMAAAQLSPSSGKASQPAKSGW